MPPHPRTRRKLQRKPTAFQAKKANSANTKRTYPLAMDCATSNYPRVIHPHETWYFLQDMYKEVRASFGKTWKESLNDHGTGMYVPFEIRDDGPRGRTIHILQDVPKGSYVWSGTHFGTFSSEEIFVAFLERLPHDLQCDVLLWAYPEKDSSSVGLALDEGSYMNHGEDEKVVNMDADCKALRDLKAGEEVLEDYGDFIGTNQDAWFNKLRDKAWGDQKQERVGDNNQVEKSYVSLGVPGAKVAGSSKLPTPPGHQQQNASDMGITDMINAIELETERHSNVFKTSKFTNNMEDETEAERSFVSEDSSGMRDRFKLIELKAIKSDQDIVARDAYEQSLYGRIYSERNIIQRVEGYKMSSRWNKNVDEEMKTALKQLTESPGLSWSAKISNTSRVRDESAAENDEHCHFEYLYDDGETIGHFLRDVCNPEDIIQINGDDGADFRLHSEDWAWMEVTREPDELKDKLVQGERAWRVIERRLRETEGYEDFPNVLPKAFVVIVSGDNDEFTKTAKHIKKLYGDGKLSSLEVDQHGTRSSTNKDEEGNPIGWRIFSVPVFLVHTPFRSSYLQLADVNSTLDGMVNKLDANLDRMLWKLDYMGKKLDVLIFGLGGFGLGFGVMMGLSLLRGASKK
ncbi:MAG: hypothetical protein SGILL_006336 [Bacillariaceae sp.]